MRAVTPLFHYLDNEIAQTHPDLHVALRANPEALKWTQPYNGCGPQPYPWHNNTPNGIYAPNHDACVSASGALHRVVVEPWAPWGGACRVLYNRVDASTPDGPQTLAALRNWRDITFDAGYSGWPSVPRPAWGGRGSIAVEGNSVYIFYIAENNWLVGKASWDDGWTWTPFLVDSFYGMGYQGRGFTVAAAHPHIVFASAGTLVGSEDCNIQGVTWNGAVWAPYPHTMKKAMRSVPTNNIVCEHTNQLAASMAPWDWGEQVVVYMDDLAGRPASSVFRQGMWSDYFPVEQIDFSKPEHDSVMYYQLGTIGNKLVLYALRNFGDSDFIHSAQGVLYYSLDGKRWSDPYYVGESWFFNFGKPLQWRGGFWLVGMQAMQRANVTKVFGGVTTYGDETRIDHDVLTLTLDEPEDQNAPAQAAITLRDEHQQFRNHPLLTDGSEVEVWAGWSGSEGVKMFEGRVQSNKPSSDRADTTISFDAIDHINNLTRGVADRAIAFTKPLRQAVIFNSEASADGASTTSGGWYFVKDGTGGFLRAEQKGYNTLMMGHGETQVLNFQITFRLTDYVPDHLEAHRREPTKNGNLGVSFFWGGYWPNCYMLRMGRAMDRAQLFRCQQLADGRIWYQYLSQELGTGYQDWTEGEFGPFRYRQQLVPNKWHTLRVYQRGKRILIYLNEDYFYQNTVPFIQFHDPNAYVGPGPVSVQGILLSGASEANEYRDMLDRRAWDEQMRQIYGGNTGMYPKYQPKDYDFNAWHPAVDVVSMMAYGNEPETTLEEFIQGIAVQRGLEKVTAPKLWSRNFVTNPGYMSYVGPQYLWSLIPGGGLKFRYAHYTQATSRWFQRTAWYWDPAIGGPMRFNEDMVINMGAYLGSYPNPRGEFGVSFGSGGHFDRTLDLVIKQVYHDGSYQSSMYLQEYVWYGRTNRRLECPVPFTIMPYSWQHYRFVAEGDWYSIYVCDQCVGTIFWPQTDFKRNGYIGISGGQQDSVASDCWISYIEVPMLGLGTIPFINVGDDLGQYLSDVLAPHGAIIVANGRNIDIRATKSMQWQEILGPHLFTSGGYEQNFESFVSHVVVTSEDREGRAISGHAYSPALWRKFGRPIVRIEEMNGLANANECRAQAQKLLAEQDRLARSRSYDGQMRLMWERYDLLHVNNQFDGTYQPLWVSGLQRTWERDEQNALRTSQTTTFEEFNPPSLELNGYHWG
jgi:hypothetical protein